MSYTLIIGNKNYSSWSMRAWLLLKFIEVDFDEILVQLYTKTNRAETKALGGQTGMVPVLKDGELAIWDTMAITEYLYESYPQIWPVLKKQRALARSFAEEIHAGLSDLRNAMPCNTRGRNRQANITQGVKADIQRVIEIWQYCNNKYPGPWLMGEFCVLDIMYAPVATRFQTYGVELTGVAKKYCEQLLAHPLVVEWLQMGEQEVQVIEYAEMPELD